MGMTWDADQEDKEDEEGWRFGCDARRGLYGKPGK